MTQRHYQFAYYVRWPHGGGPDVFCAVAVRLAGRKRWGVRVARASEWLSVEMGAPVQREDSFSVVKNGLSVALRAASERQRFHLFLTDDTPWSRIGEKFRWSALCGLSDEGSSEIIEYARRVMDRGEHQALKG